MSVPVLSMQSVSTRAIDSTAFWRWTRAPRWLIRSAPVAYVTVTMIARPCGTSVTRTAAAVRVWVEPNPPGSAARAMATGMTARSTSAATTQIVAAISRWSGVRSSPTRRGLRSSRFAKLAAPTDVTSKTAVPEIDRAPRQDRVAGPPRDRVRLAGEQRLVQLDAALADERAVEEHLVAPSRDEEVAEDDLRGIDRRAPRLADDASQRAGQRARSGPACASPATRRTTPIPMLARTGPAVRSASMTMPNASRSSETTTRMPLMPG